VLKQLTIREVKAAHYVDKIGGLKEVVDDLVAKDYYSGPQAFPERYNLDIASVNPTGIE
jgi:hypothetical protein